MTGLQCDLFGMPARRSVPAARRNDPDTSKDAARAALELAAHHQALIHQCLKAAGPRGKDGIAARTGITGVQVARRLPELQRMGLVKPTGKRVCSTSGRTEREWMVA